MPHESRPGLEKRSYIGLCLPTSLSIRYHWYLCVRRRCWCWRECPGANAQKQQKVLDARGGRSICCPRDDGELTARKVTRLPSKPNILRSSFRFSHRTQQEQQRRREGCFLLGCCLKSDNLVNETRCVVCTTARPRFVYARKAQPWQAGNDLWRQDWCWMTAFLCCVLCIFRPPWLLHEAGLGTRQDIRTTTTVAVVYIGKKRAGISVGARQGGSSARRSRERVAREKGGAGILAKGDKRSGFGHGGERSHVSKAMLAKLASLQRSLQEPLSCNNPCAFGLRPWRRGVPSCVLLLISGDTSAQRNHNLRSIAACYTKGWILSSVFVQ